MIDIDKTYLQLSKIGLSKQHVDVRPKTEIN